MKEEDFIRQKLGKKEPFSVPENYFQDFTKQFMESLPESAPVLEIKMRSRFDRIKYWAVSAAAVVCIAFSTLWFMERRSSDAAPEMPVAQSPVVYDGYYGESDYYVNDMLDYALVDNSEIAMYITGAN